jgi:hypothetical protein
MLVGGVLLSTVRTIIREEFLLSVRRQTFSIEHGIQGTSGNRLNDE